MRLHTLTFSAFGPFAGTETIDFDQLADAGLFLLHGPTGAGKTTILDAVSFALFAKVPGVRAAGDSLRSDFADRSVATEVRLEVSIGEQRFRIVRRPKQVRPKTRGTGLREHPPTATVEELVGGAWVARASRPTEADPFLAERLHMGADQFHQLVMLPQGEFARFLRATADDRRQVLEELFGTHRFAEVERWLKLQADAAHTALHDTDEQARRLLVAAERVTDLDLVPFADDRPLADAPSWLAELGERVHHRAATARHAADAADPASQAALAALTEGSAIAERQRRHADAVQAQVRLAASVDEQTARRAAREHAYRAASVIPLADQAHRAALALACADRTVLDRRAALAALAPEIAGRARDALTARLDELAGEVARVDDLLPDERQLDQRAAQVEQLDEQVAALVPVLQQLSDERDTLPGERRRMNRQLRQAEKQADRVADLERQSDLIADCQVAATRRDQLEAEVGRQDQQVTRLRTLELDAREHSIGEREAQQRNRAALLADGLADGDPCPVCGSADHPQLATADGPVVTDDQLAAAESIAADAVEATRRATEVLTKLQRELDTVTAAAAGLSVEAVVEQRRELEAALVDARDAVARRDDLQQKLTELEARAVELDAQLRSAGELIAEAREQRAASDQGLADVRARVTAACAGASDLTTRRELLLRERAAVTAVTAALDTLEAAATSAADADADAQAEATARGFADLAEARAAGLDDRALAELDAALAVHDQALAETTVELGRDELVRAAALAPVELGPLRQASDEAQHARDVAAIAAAAATKADDDLTRIQREVADLVAGRAPQLERYETLRRLADLANGDDRQVDQRMRLSTYVLSARLEQVAAAASERLSRMSGGQFTIVHTDDATDGRRKGGLGLRVVDAWTGTERETSTLSGGQTFFTSLALALGVADVVGAETGGTRIDTLFIDEGFGSLDDDTLEQVMDVLDGLRAGGRTIGVVSHVADLRTRLTSQIEVVKTARGSHVRSPAVARSVASAPDQLRDDIGAA